MTPAVPVRETVLSFVDARNCVELHAAGLRPGSASAVELLQATGRILAEEIKADRDFPPFPRATRDGYAVRSADIATVPAKLTAIGQIKAGDSLAKDLGPISPGSCVEIMTGAPVPAGADAVVMVEYTSAMGNTVDVNRSATWGENIVPAGSEARAGQVLVQAGTSMNYAQIAVAAAVGKAKVSVFERPRVAILSTGDEIVDVNAKPSPNQIRNSNSYSLAAQVTAAGGEPLQLPIAPDESARLRELIREGLGADLLLLSGGVSMGKYDLVEQILAEEEFATQFFFTGAMIQPGKPVVFGRAKRPDGGRAMRPDAAIRSSVKQTHFLGLPGNPISTMVTFELFARPLIGALSGASAIGLHFALARLKSDFKTKIGLTRFLPAVLTGGKQDAELSAEVEPVRWQGSGDIVAAAGANCYLVVPPDRNRLTAGDVVTVLLR